MAQETRDRIQELARDMGWRPNAELTRHMSLVRVTGTTKAAGNLAIVINKPQSELDYEDTPRRFVAGARERASQLGYNIDVFNLAGTRLTPARLRAVLRARGIKGILYIGTLNTAPSLGHLRIGRDFAVAVVGMRFPEVAYHVAINNLLATGQTAVVALRERGYQRPAAILPRALDQALAWGFSAGIHAGQLALPATQRIDTLLVGELEIYLPDAAFPKIRRWVLQEQPDALLTTDVRNLSRCLADWPETPSPPPVFSLDFYRGQPAAGGVDQRSSAVGAAGVDLVVAQLNRGTVGVPPVAYTLEVEGIWEDACDLASR